MDDNFGHWFAGFVAGEGCFDIPSRGPKFGCRFSMNLRDDDIAIIRKIQIELGHGRIHHVKNRHHAPNVKFEVDTKDGCLALCELFIKYPLRAKKADDFKVWKEAVYEWLKIKNDRWNPEINENIWKNISYLQIQLRNGRKYKEVA